MNPGAGLPGFIYARIAAPGADGIVPGLARARLQADITADGIVGVQTYTAAAKAVG